MRLRPQPSKHWTTPARVAMTVVAILLPVVAAAESPLAAAEAPAPQAAAEGPGTAAQHLTPIALIQGRGPVSPLVGQRVSTAGVVTAILPDMKGFFLQDPVGDGDPATSEGIFVYLGEVPLPAGVEEGALLRLSGRVSEYRGRSELVSPGPISVLGRGPLIAPLAVAFPTLNHDGLERHEGMLVRIDAPLTVTGNALLSRFGQLTLAAGGRQFVPTDRFAPGSPRTRALKRDNLRRRLVLDDGSARQNPFPPPYLDADGTRRAGDRVIGPLIGIVDEGPIDAVSPPGTGYRLHPAVEPGFAPRNPRPAAPPPSVGSTLRVASFNVQNYFNGDGASGGFPTRRGAASLASFQHQRAKLIAALASLDADVSGLMEVENDGDGQGSAIQDLVDGLNAKLGDGTYRAVPDPNTGNGGDAIKVALLYKPARVRTDGGSLSDTAPVHDRPPLAQAFVTSTGKRFVVVVSHFKSRRCGGAGPAERDAGDGQGCFNARRVAQAARLADFVQQIRSAAGTADVLVIGDLNAYSQEAPLRLLASRGLATPPVARRKSFHTYVHEGLAGRLDHVLASPGMGRRVVAVAAWPINADEPSLPEAGPGGHAQACPPCDEARGTETFASPYRSSDHDPLLIGIRMEMGAAQEPPATRPRR